MSREVSEQLSRLPDDSGTPETKSHRPADIAIIGMACLFPGAPRLDTYWQNILNKVNSVTDAPPEAWDVNIWYDPNATGSDKVYCKKGGWIGPLAYFDPLANGIPPMAVGGEPDQWLALQIARDALADAGYQQIPEELKKRTSLVLGRGAYLNAGNLAAIQHGIMIGQTLDILKAVNPDLTEEQLATIKTELKKGVPAVNPDTVPGLIPNLIVGRVANRLDIMGPTYTVDAACASSLVAMQLALRDLQTGESDLALVGGSQISTAVPVLNVFCQVGALSRRQELRAFDKDADGTLLGEGIGMVVLKRLADAERDRDRIYAVVKGVGVASDGRAIGVLAPRVEGEELALRRAYENADVDPRTVALVEAHGTGAPVGDQSEVQALTRVFGPRDGQLARCGIGTVKSMISHTMPAAGIAGLIKAALSLNQKVLPPTLNVDTPNPKLELERTPFYINTETRPWIHGGKEPRRAGVNAFGFGGINGHVVLEEYVGPLADTGRPVPTGRQLGMAEVKPRASLPAHFPEWETEVIILAAETPLALLDRVRGLGEFLEARAPAASEVLPPAGKPGAGEREASLRLKDLAYTLNRELASEPTGGATVRLGLVVSTLSDLQAKLVQAAKRLADPNCRQIRDVAGIYYTAKPLGALGKVAFLFPGEGSQYPSMLADLCLHFPEVREIFDKGDRIYADHPRRHVPSDYVFPRPAFSLEEKSWAERMLWQIDGAIEAVIMADDAIFQVLKRLQITPDVIVGHSTGEYAAMRAAGILDLEEEAKLAQFALAMNQNYQEWTPADGPPRAALLAVGAPREKVEEIAREAGGDIHLAMDNCPHQSVVAGPVADVERALELVKRAGYIYEFLTFDRAYHTSLFEPYVAHMEHVFGKLSIAPASTPMYSCTSVGLFPTDPGDIRRLMVDHWVRAVEFRRTVEQMYADGVRIFVEVGPRGNLTAFVEDILRGRPHSAVASNVQRRSGLSQLNHMLAVIAVQGVHLDLGYLYQRRDVREIDLTDVTPSLAGSNARSLLKLPTGTALMRLPAELARDIRGTVPLANGIPASYVAQPTTGASHVDISVAEPILTGATFAGLPSSEPDEPTTSDPGSTPSPFDAEALRLDAGLDWTHQPLVQVDPANAPVLSDEAMGDFMDTMEKFLSVQDHVMRSFLWPTVTDSAEFSETSSALVPLDVGDIHGAEPGGPSSDEWSVEAIGPANGNGAHHGSSPRSVAIEPIVDQPQSAPTQTVPMTSSPGALVDPRLLEVISARTGFPPEMLGVDLDLEADLGIDPVKRVEILASFQRQFGEIGVDIGALATKHTIRQIAEAVASSGTASRSPDTSERGAADARRRPTRAEVDAAVANFPLLGTVVSFGPGEELVTRRTFDPAEDLFLRDHTIGRFVSAFDRGILPLALLPMTISLEIMAEAAACLMPGLTVIGLRDLRANRWIPFEDDTQTLQVMARRDPDADGSIRVQIRNLTEDSLSDSPPKSPVAEVIVVFGETYPTRPAIEPLHLTDERSSRWRDDQLYADVMFHGPMWQAITSVTRTGRDGAAARGKVLPFDGFLRSSPNPNFILDPISLDAAGQVPGFWTREHLESGDGDVLFPFRADSLDLYGPLRDTNETYTCEASIHLVSELQLRSDIDVFDMHGNLWMRLIGWVDKRFYLPPWFYSMLLSLSAADVSVAWTEPVSHFPRPERFECRRLTATFPSDRNFWKRVWANSILGRRERQAFRQQTATDLRQLMWLVGRMAAKEAVHAVLHREYGLDVPPADIEILSNPDGRLVVDGLWRDLVPTIPFVALAQTGDTAVATAGLPPEGPRTKQNEPPAVGMGLAKLGRRQEGADGADFERSILLVLERVGGHASDEWRARAQCAREAVAAALSPNTVDGFRSIDIVDVDPIRETIEVRLSGALALAHPRLAARSLVVYTSRLNDLVVATTLSEAGSH